MTENFRVANIIEEARWGGPQKRISLVASVLKNMGIETKVLVPKLNSERFCDELDTLKVKWHSLKIHRIGRGWRTLLLYGATFVPDVFRIWKELTHGEYDVVHVSGGAWQVKGLLAGALAGIPVLWHLNDTQMPRVLVQGVSVLSFLASGFIVTANRVREYYLQNDKFNDKEIYLIQAPVNTALYNRDVVEPCEEILSMPSLKILTVANINPVKGIDTLIKAAAFAKNRLGSLSLIVIGSVHETQYEYFKYLEGLVSSLSLGGQVHFFGARKNVPSAMKACDVFVCSSVAESGPMSVWEAMSMECAIVSTDVGDVAEFLTDGERGSIVPVGDAQALADAVVILASKEEMRKEFGERARKVALDNFDLGIIAKKTAIAYQAVCNK